MIQTSPVVPAVAHLHGDTRVARLAQRHQIICVVGATVTEREDVMHFLGGCQFALLLTFFTQRMRLDVAVTDPFPSPAIAFVGLRLALKMIVMAYCLPLMLGAIKAVGQLGAAGILARSLWFLWHGFASLEHEKSPRRFPHEGSQPFFSGNYNDIIWQGYQSMSLGITLQKPVANI